MKQLTQISIIITAILLVLVSCQSGPPEIEEGLKPAELFKRAQEAVINDKNYKEAMAYYKAALERYPNDVQNRVIAEYEIAFLHYKMGEVKTAEQLFRSL